MKKQSEANGSIVKLIQKIWQSISIKKHGAFGVGCACQMIGAHEKFEFMTPQEAWRDR